MSCFVVQTSSSFVEQPVDDQTHSRQTEHNLRTSFELVVSTKMMNQVPKSLTYLREEAQIERISIIQGECAFVVPFIEAFEALLPVAFGGIIRVARNDRH